MVRKREMNLHICKYIYKGPPSTNHVDSFLGFFDPPSPLWTNMDILGTPLPVHVDFSMTPPSSLFPKIFSKYQSIGILKSKHTTRYLWNI